MTGAATAGDVDYDSGDIRYTVHRQTDPRIAALVHAALGAADTVLNVGAGAGSYEPTGVEVTAVEPSAAMRASRPPDGAPAIDATADQLPFPDQSFDAAMATLTIHHWPDTDAGLRELRRVSRGPVVIMTFDPDALDRLWLADYAPELIAAERSRYPALDHISAVLGGEATVQAVPIPIDCVDGFTEAFYARPEKFLDASIRRSQSAWGFVEPAAIDAGMRRLDADLRSGEWDRRFGALRSQPEFVGALRLVVARP